MNTIEVLGGVLMAGAGCTCLAAAVVTSRSHGRSALAYLTEEGGAASIETPAPTEDGDGMAPVVERLVRPLATRLIDSVKALYPSANLDHIHSQLLQAGMSTKIRAEEFATLRILSAIIGVAAALGALAIGPGSLPIRLLIAAMLALVGIVGPGAWLGGRVQDRTKSISHDLADTLDLLTISVEAGQGLESAIETACADVDSPLASELARTLQEMSLGLSRSQALENLKLRTAAEDLKTFVLVLTQADMLGMPIGRVLRTQADEMRDRRRARAREQAAKLPVKILFPLMAFILPPLMIVVMGPAAINVMHSFSKV